MALVPLFLRRRYLTTGLVAVVVPLAVLLGLQYASLHRLREMSGVAHRAALRGTLDAIAWQAQQQLQERADILAVPSSTPPDRLRELLQSRWAEAPRSGAARLFVMDYSRELFGNLLFFDPTERALISPSASDEALAIIVTCSPWQLDVYRGEAVQVRGLVVDERDPKRRMLLRPLLDEQDHVVAIVGMVLDQESFRTEFLPPLALAEMRTHLPASVREQATLHVLDGRGKEVLRMKGDGQVVSPDESSGAGPEDANAAPADAWAASMSLPLVYTDWTLSVGTPGLEVERWARTGFVYNMTLSVLLAALLLGGVVLALRAANRAVRLSEMKSEFVSNVSHELRTPLASIRAFGEFLRLGRASDAKVREYGEHIESESRRLSRLIDNILDFSRIESGSKTYRFERGRLEDVVESVVEAFRVRTRRSGFRLSWQRPAAPLPELELDADAMGQVLYNLLDNAVKYSGESRSIDVALSREGPLLVCTVTDEGVGIARDEQPKVFDRFHRVGTDLVHDVKGSGLGLSIVKHIVAAHRGEVSLASEPGRGTVVTIRLPLAGTT